MKNNTEQVLFEGVVIDARKSETTDPPSEIIDLSYEVEPYDVAEVDFNEQSGEVIEKFVYTENQGWIQICLPVFNGLKPGDKIKVVKI